MTQQMLDRVVVGAFWSLCVMCLLNLNDVGRMWIGAEEFFSLPMLLCCLLILPGLSRMRIVDALGGMGALLVAALASYAGIGIVMAIATGSASSAGAWDYLVRYLISILIILAAAIGGRIVVQRAGHENALLGVLGLLTASCALTLASPWLLRVFQNPPLDASFRYFGVFANPNEAGFVACLAVALALSFIRTGRFAVLAYGSLFVAVPALIGTYSRTALITLLVLVIGGALASRGNERWRALGGMVAVGLFFVNTMTDMNAGILLESQIGRLESLIAAIENRSADDVTMAGRLTLWRLALDETLESPLVGLGLGQLHSLDAAWLTDEGIPLGAHNMYLMLWGEAGIVPLILFVLFLAGMLRLGIGTRPNGLAAGAVGGWGMALLLTAITSHSLLLNRPANLIIGIACALAAARCSRRQDIPRTGPTASATPRA